MITFPEIEEGKGPILILNMLKFRDKRTYFEEYIPAFNQVIKQLGIDGVKVALVTEVFKSMALSEEYSTIAGPLREAALEHLKLIMTKRTDF